jgi:hypothetical protein
LADEAHGESRQDDGDNKSQQEDKRVEGHHDAAMRGADAG